MQDFEDFEELEAAVQALQVTLLSLLECTSREIHSAIVAALADRLETIAPDGNTARWRALALWQSRVAALAQRE